MSRQRDWSSLSQPVINRIADKLNAVDHAHLRSVCCEWHTKIEKRRNAPLVILVERDIRDNIIQALSFFDITHREIIPLRRLASSRVRNSCYLGSSHGWIFIGKFILHSDGKEELEIVLLNPFDDRIEGVITLPPLADLHRGRVFLSRQPTHLHDFVVLYHTPGNALVRFWKRGEHQWRSFRLRVSPDDVVSNEGHFYGNFKGKLFEFDLVTRGLLDFELRVPGLLPHLSSDPALWLRYFQDRCGKLYTLFTSSYQGSIYCFKKVEFVSNRTWDTDFDHPPCTLRSERHYLILDDFTVVEYSHLSRLPVDDYNPIPLLLRLSTFWSKGQNQWQPVGWITPILL